MSHKDKIAELKKRKAIQKNEPLYCTEKVSHCLYNRQIPIDDILEKRCNKYYIKNNDKVVPCRNTIFPSKFRTCIKNHPKSNQTLKDMCKERDEHRSLYGLRLSERKSSVRRSSGRKSSGRRSSERRSSERRSSRTRINPRRSSSIRRSEIRKANTRRSSSSRRFDDLMKQNEKAFYRMNNR